MVGNNGWCKCNPQKKNQLQSNSFRKKSFKNYCTWTKNLNFYSKIIYIDEAKIIKERNYNLIKIVMENCMAKKVKSNKREFII